MISRIKLIVLFIFCGICLNAQTALQGKVTDGASGEPIIFGTVAVYKNGSLITGTETDFDGNYLISPIDPGTYDVEFSYIGYQSERVVGMVVKADQSNKLDKAISEGVLLTTAVIVDYKAPLIDFDNTTQGKTITSEDIRSLPTKNINAIAATSAGLSSVDGGDISIRGSRSNATDYYIDGIRVRSTSGVPQSEIDQLQVITGGLDAKYGDVTGGIISITTKGPSNSYTGGFELETSEGLDPYGYNLLMANLAGPILKDSDGQSVLGFRLSGQYRDIADPSPSAVGVYRAPESLIDSLEQNPTTPNFGNLISTAETLRLDDIGEPLDARPNTGIKDLNLTAKIDARLSDNIDISISGSYFDSEDKFAPSGAWALYNWRNNPVLYENSYRANFRFRHKLGNQNIDSEATDEEKADAGLIRNVTYTIQAGYEKFYDRREDIRHEDRLFNYGYYGQIDRVWEPQITGVADENFPTPDGLLAHQGYLEVASEFIPNLEINPVLARYNQINSIPDNNLENIWGMWNNVGQVYNRFEKNESDRYTGLFSTSFDLIPGGSESGRHNIQIGLNFEQRINRRWVILPEDLWLIGSLNANRHITGVDTTDIVDVITINGPLGQTDYPIYAPLSQADEFPDNYFFRSVRTLTGQAINEYVNVDGLNPSDLSLDMFSAAELNDRRINSYYGFDYEGNKVSTNTTFEDFFRSVDNRGVRNFLVAPLQPVYGAAYIQDKFTFDDIILRLGVRVDYFDANTKVLKDPYSLYEVESAVDFTTRTGIEHQGAVGDDYKVYVDGENSDNIIGYRNGEEWFAPNGTRVSGGNILFGGGLVFPSFKERDDQKRNIQDPDFDPDISFADYDPQLNIMPRVAFSFPISEDAGFFAHYDVLVQRPPSNTAETALDYYYYEANPPNLANNSNLLPEKTIDYEVGFQQKLSNSSALKVSAYYKELRDMIQRRFFLHVPAPINNYQTFGNLDFGTVKGFSFAYDMRRTGNLQLNATYTLQFADGTGSDANSSGGLNGRGDLRNLFPLSFDERHRLTAVIDYRYGSGKDYNGPTIGDMDIFSNLGINLILTTVSGRPYTQNREVFAFNTTGAQSNGIVAINEARLPWNFNADLRVDKTFDIKFSEDSKKGFDVNVYFRLENLFNVRNIIGVYDVTGDPDDDGWLASARGLGQQQLISDAQRDLISYQASYQWRLLSPGNFARPRRIYLGAVVNF